MGIKGILLDLYKTLIYSNDLLNDWSDLRKVLKNKKNFILYSEEILPVLQRGDWDTVESMSAYVADRIKISQVELRDYYMKDIESVMMYDETIPFLKEVKGKKLRTGIISNVTIPYLAPLFSLGLDEYFDVIYLSCRERHRKPEKVSYLSALNRLGLDASKVVMIGDNREEDVMVPASLGIRALLLDRDGIFPNERKRLGSLMEFFGIEKNEGLHSP